MRVRCQGADAAGVAASCCRVEFGILPLRIGPTFYDPQIGNAKTKARLRIIATKKIWKYRNKTTIMTMIIIDRITWRIFPQFSSIFCCVKLLPNLQRLQIMWGGQFWTGPEVSAPKARWGPVFFPADAQSLRSNPQCCWWWIRNYDILWYTDIHLIY